MKQSRLMSLVEAATNVVVGYGLAIATQIVVFPWFGLQADLPAHLTIGLLFLIVSLLRSYLLRRLFERHRPCGERPIPGGARPANPSSRSPRLRRPAFGLRRCRDRGHGPRGPRMPMP
jgi:hypothetical protein